jgi:hypothetical protein
LIEGNPDSLGPSVGTFADTSVGNLIMHLFLSYTKSPTGAFYLNVKVFIPEGANQPGKVAVNILTPGYVKWNN